MASLKAQLDHRRKQVNPFSSALAQPFSSSPDNDGNHDPEKDEGHEDVEGNGAGGVFGGREHRRLSAALEEALKEKTALEQVGRLVG